MQQSIVRTGLLAAITTRLAEAPVVAVLGARQVGKTTLARQLHSWPGGTLSFDLEVATERDALARTPDRVLRSGEGLVVLDEVQRMPEIFEILRPICDDPGRKAVFLLLGSASIDLVRGVSETLAGRILFVEMGGLSLAEVGAANHDRLWMRGGFPRAYLAESAGAWRRWMESFTRTFVERDIPGLRPGVSAEGIGRFWRMLAHLHGQTWNASELARSLDTRTKSVMRYRDLLEGAFMVRVLKPWFTNLGKRLVKSPRVYLRDSGMLHHLLGLEEMDDLLHHPRYGASWEGFALEQTLLAHGEREAYFYRTQRGAELDLLLLRRGRRWGFEFKCTETPQTTKSMHIVKADLELEHLWVIYPGELEYRLADGITALPVTRVHDLSLRPQTG